MNTKILLLQKLDNNVLKEVEDGNGDISEEIIATCEYMDDLSTQRDLLKRYLFSTIDSPGTCGGESEAPAKAEQGLTSANSLVRAQKLSSSLEPAAGSVTFDSCGSGTCSPISTGSGAQAPHPMPTAGWNSVVALATSTPGGPSTPATGNSIPMFSSSG